ncbi:MAG: MBL fold metallo-hydrolase [Acidobacteriota bacterium]
MRIFAPVILLGLIGTIFNPAEGASLPAAQGGLKSKVAVVTFISAPEQERAVKALVQSIRKWGGEYRNSQVYVVSTDIKELPGNSLRMDGVEVLALEMDPAYLSYPLAFKAFAAAQVENKVKGALSTLIWLDPGAVVFRPLALLDLAGRYDAAVRPVTLANTIGLPPQTPPNDYWKPIYGETGLDFAKLPTIETVVDGVRIQPYYNCESFSFNPDLRLAREWARLLTGRLQDEVYQEQVCTTFLRRLFLHQAVLSAVISANVRPDRLKALPLAGGYPFAQHERVSAPHKAARLNDLTVAIFDTTWDTAPGWMKAVPIDEPLRSWLAGIYMEYIEIAPGIYRIEGSCNSYLVAGDGGSVLIDPAGAAVAPEYFERILAGSPLRAILLTHAHRDHSDDIARWRQGRDIPVVAQRGYKRYFEYLDEMKGFFARRNAIWAGGMPDQAMPEAPAVRENPTVFFSDEYEINAAGLRIQMLHRPGETPDHAVIWIPGRNAVFVGDNYYEYFINNSTFRGTMIRPVGGYIDALETAIAFEPEYFLPGHGAPLLSKKEVTGTAGSFLEALKFIHDETLKGINAGKDLPTLVREIRLPSTYRIIQAYGKVEWTVRGIWQEYVGWFDENPETMYAAPSSDVFPDLVSLAGGERILERARVYLESRELQKALHLTHVVLEAEPRNRSANEIRLSALERLLAGTNNYVEKIWLSYAIRQCRDNLK